MVTDGWPPKVRWAPPRDRGAVGPPGDVGGADLERLGAEQVREGHPHLRPADARPHDLPNRLVPHPHRRARCRRRHLFRLHIGRRRIDGEGPGRPGTDPPALRRRDGGNRQEDRGDGGQREYPGAPARGSTDRTDGPTERGKPAYRHPAIQSAGPARRDPIPAHSLDPDPFATLVLLYRHVPGADTCRPAGKSTSSGSHPAPGTPEPVASGRPAEATRNRRPSGAPQGPRARGQRAAWGSRLSSRSRAPAAGTATSAVRRLRPPRPPRFRWLKPSTAMRHLDNGGHWKLPSETCAPSG